jgi:putative membrane protein
MDPRVLPTVNAALNGISAALAILGYVLVRRGYRRAHKLAMLGAFAASSAFLVSYLAYHAVAGSVKYRGQGALRAVYLLILASHSVLAAAVVPLVLLTLHRALCSRFDDHRRLARLTLPIWAYVSATGVLVYYMLYHT